jgi:hypothetical protein
MEPFQGIQRNASCHTNMRHYWVKDFSAKPYLAASLNFFLKTAAGFPMLRSFFEKPLQEIPNLIFFSKNRCRISYAPLIFLKTSVGNPEPWLIFLKTSVGNP